MCVCGQLEFQFNKSLYRLVYLAQVGGKELSKVSGIKHESFIGKERKGKGVRGSANKALSALTRFFFPLQTFSLDNEFYVNLCGLF